MMRARVVTRIEVEAWASPRPGMTLDDLIARLSQAGATVLEVDRDGGRVKVLHAVQEQ